VTLEFSHAVGRVKREVSPFPEFFHLFPLGDSYAADEAEAEAAGGRGVGRGVGDANANARRQVAREREGNGGSGKKGVKGWWGKVRFFACTRARARVRVRAIEFFGFFCFGGSVAPSRGFCGDVGVRES
jgi:hypothetical protein